MKKLENYFKPKTTNCTSNSKKADVEVVESDELMELDELMEVSSSEEEENNQPSSSKNKRLFKNYKQHFRSEWLNAPEFKNWVQIKPGNKDFITCKYCLGSIRAKKSSLKDHMNSKKHISKIHDLNFLQPLITKSKKKTDKTKIAEARFSLYVAKHTSIATSDHLSKTLRASFPTAHAFSLGRTKCTSIIKNIWHPYFINSLKEDIGDSCYSLILDESTDVGVVKFLGLVIKYYSKEKGAIIGTFLKLQVLESGDSDSIVAAIKSVTKEFGLNLQKLTGIGTDNANVMTGSIGGVYGKLKKEVRHLVLVPCVCHSLQLAISEVCKNFLPTELEFLISETYNWFARSSIRQESYKLLFRAINDGHDPLKILQTCLTRWLSIESCVSRILDQWLELETHFQIAKNVEKCYNAECLSNFYKNPLLKAYLLFIHPHLKRVQRVNKMFQGSSSTDMSMLFDELCLLISETAYAVTQKRRDFDPLTSSLTDYIVPNAFLGYAFETHILECKASKLISNDDERDLRKKCIGFIEELVKSLRKRLPHNIVILKSISLLSVKNALTVIKDDLTKLTQELQLSPLEITEVNNQWKSLTLVNWNCSKTTTTMEFDAAGNNRFEDLTNVAMRLLSLPFSNAEVERVFSQMNIIKNKLRNRMQATTLNAVLNVRYSLERKNVCGRFFHI